MASKVTNFVATYTFEDIIGISNNLLSAVNMGKNAALSSSNVLILGESGTGKELFAQAIHNASNRSDKPFVTINCGAIPKSLIESELFGYEGGAFTGAKKQGHLGKFELADGGTLFLDEIGDMPLELQVSLLRVLQTHEVLRVGGTNPKIVDVRIIAATNIDLLDAVRNKAFRSDLFYRLNVLNIDLPSLRERKTDIPLLAKHFANLYAHSLRNRNCVIFPDAMDALINYNWPGNIRELENAIERSINIMDGDELRAVHLSDAIINSPKDNNEIDSFTENDITIYPRGKSEIVSATSSYSTAAPSDYPSNGFGGSSDINPETDRSQIDGSSPEIQERNQIIEYMRKEHGHVQTVAAQMNIPVSTLYRKLRKYNINSKKFKMW